MTPLQVVEAAREVNSAIPKPAKRGVFRWLLAKLGLRKVERDTELRKANYRAEGERQRGER